MTSTTVPIGRYRITGPARLGSGFRNPPGKSLRLGFVTCTWSPFFKCGAGALAQALACAVAGVLTPTTLISTIRIVKVINKRFTAQWPPSFYHIEWRD